MGRQDGRAIGGARRPGPARTAQCEQRPARASRRRSRAQSLVIFALSFTVLLSMAGLAVDTLRAFDLYGRMQRAAEAGALAGVLYMPSYYNTVRPGDSDSAVSRAMKEVIKNGFGAPISATASASQACPTTGPAEVAICQVSGTANQLRVKITEQLNVVLLGALGLGPTTVSASGQAEYLPPVQLGSRLNYFGDQVECSNANPPDPSQTHACLIGANSSTDNHLQYFLATMKGPATLKERGDPMVYCEEGPANIGATDGPSYNYMTYNDITSPPSPSTNHQQWTDSITNHCGLGSASTPGNPDRQPAGFDGPATQGTAHPGGYTYQVIVPAGVTDASLWIYNPSFVEGGPGGFDSLDIYPKTQTATGGGVTSSNTYHDSPAMYFHPTYSLYAVVSQFDRGSDTLVKTTSYPAYDAYSSDTARHACGGTTPAYDPYWQDFKGTGPTINTYYNPLGTFLGNGNGCLDLSTNTAPSWNSTAPAPCYMQWCPFIQHLAAGTYRFIAEGTGYITNTSAYTSGTTDGAGAHSYALRLCSASGMSSPLGCSNGASGGNPGVTIFGWNNVEIAFNAQMGQETPSTTNPASTCVTSNATKYTCLDLGCIPTAYAGRTVNIGLFDPGDGGGDIYIGVVAPPGSGATVSYASWVPTTTIDGDTVVHARFSSPSYNAFNGLRLTATVTLPSAYTGDCGSGPSATGWWQMVYASASGTPNDTLNVAFSLVGSPVHLIPPSLG